MFYNKKKKKKRKKHTPFPQPSISSMLSTLKRYKRVVSYKHYLFNLHLSIAIPQRPLSPLLTKTPSTSPQHPPAPNNHNLFKHHKHNNHHHQDNKHIQTEAIACLSVEVKRDEQKK